jgi:hypothetical protein
VSGGLILPICVTGRLFVHVLIGELLQTSPSCNVQDITMSRLFVVCCCCDVGEPTLFTRCREASSVGLLDGNDPGRIAECAHLDDSYALRLKPIPDALTEQKRILDESLLVLQLRDCQKLVDDETMSRKKEATTRTDTAEFSGTTQTNLEVISTMRCDISFHIASQCKLLLCLDMLTNSPPIAQFAPSHLCFGRIY